MTQKIILNVRESGQYAPRVIRLSPTLVTVRPGATAILECPGIGNPVPKATWSRPDINNGKIFSSNNRTIIQGYGVEIQNVTKDDVGTYFCELDNGIAPTLVHKVRLQILEAPVITDGPSETLTNESDSLYLTCQAKGSPVPQIYWMINGQNCRFDSQTIVNDTHLYIREVEKRHAGIVQCFARNDIGESTSWNLLQVIPKQIPGESGSVPLGSMPASTKFNSNRTGKPTKKKRKRCE